MNDATDPYEALQDVLGTASTILGELVEDRQLRRLLTVFARMPQEDREPMLGILEREVDARLLSDATTAATAMRLRLHPGARLYTRVIEPEPSIVRQEAIMAAVRAMRMFRREIGPAPEVWEATVLEALRGLEPDEFASIARFNRMVLGLIERREHEVGSA